MLAIDPFSGLASKKKINPLDPTGANSGRDAQGGYGPTGTVASTGGGVGPGGGVQPSLTIPGYTPDYGSLIANDPVYLQLQKDLAAQGVSDVATRNAAINRALIQFGQVPDMANSQKALGLDLSQILDPTTGGLAAANKFSTQAQLGTAHTDALSQIKHALAARGALHSGELGYQLGKENQAYGQAQNDSTQKLLDALSQLQSGFVGNQRAQQQQGNQGLQDATQRQLQQNPATGSQTAMFDASTGLYKDGNGNYWNADGTPAQRSSQSAVSQLGQLPAQSYDFGAPSQYDAGWGSVNKMLGF